MKPVEILPLIDLTRKNFDDLCAWYDGAFGDDSGLNKPHRPAEAARRSRVLRPHLVVGTPWQADVCNRAKDGRGQLAHIAGRGQPDQPAVSHATA